MKNKSTFGINLTNIYKVIDGKKYQFMGVYPDKKELQLDLERVHRKHGFVIKFTKLDEKMEVWRRKKWDI